MKYFLVALLLLIPTYSFADKTLQCEKYTVEVDKPVKQKRTIFKFTFSSEENSITYENISGSNWSIPSGTKLNIVWKSEDNLRFVAYWVNEKYEKDNNVWHPVYMLDIDFKKPRYEMETYGGFSDFSELIDSPWKQECIRLD